VIKISTLSDFEVQAAASNYLRLTPGKHRIRVLGDAISGWVWWEDTADGGRKPTRIKLTQPIPVNEGAEAKKFIAMPIWNYDLNKIQIWEVTQVTIQRELKSLDADPDWGNLMDYDIEIERQGNDKMTTKYFVRAKPKTDPSKEIVGEVGKGLPTLEALYLGTDPFQEEVSDESLADLEKTLNA